MKISFSFLFFLIFLPCLVFAQNVDEINKSIRTVEGLFQSGNEVLTASQTLKINYDDISEKVDFVTKRKVSDSYSLTRIQSLYLDDIHNDSFYVEMINLADFREEDRGTYLITLKIKVDDDAITVVDEKLNKKEFPLPIKDKSYKNQVVINGFPSLSLPLIKKVINNMAKIIGVSASKFFMYNSQTEALDEVNTLF